MSQANATAYCKSLDKRAHLAEIKTQEIQTIIEGLEHFQSHDWWWLGGNDKAQVWNVFLSVEISKFSCCPDFLRKINLYDFGSSKIASLTISEAFFSIWENLTIFSDLKFCKASENGKMVVLQTRASNSDIEFRNSKIECQYRFWNSRFVNSDISEGLDFAKFV